jgi:hypothetical protein
MSSIKKRERLVKENYSLEDEFVIVDQSSPEFKSVHDMESIVHPS